MTNTKKIIGEEKFLDNIRSLKIKSNSDFSKLESEYDEYRQIKENHGNISEKLNKYENLENFKTNCLAKIGNEEDINEAQKLKKHGDWENIYKKLDEYEEIKGKIMKLEIENNSWKSQLIELNKFKELCLEKIGDSETIDKMSNLRKYGNIEDIYKNLMNMHYAKVNQKKWRILRNYLLIRKIFGKSKFEKSTNQKKR